MAREFAKVKSAIWQDDDFRSLPPLAQHLYFVILTDPELSYCGVADWRPRRMAPKSSGWTTDEIQNAGSILTEHKLLIVDEETEEVLVRSFLRHDGVMQHNKLCVSAATAFSAVASNTLRGVIVHELQRLQNEFPEWPSWERQQVQEVLKRNAVDPATATPLANPLAPGLAPNLAPELAATPGAGLASALQQQQQQQLTTATSSNEDGAASDKSNARRGTRIPDNFTVTDRMQTWARENVPEVDIRFETQKFINHWTAATGSNAVKRDWVATWRNWMLNEKKFAAERARPSRPAPKRDGRGNQQWMYS